VSDTLPQVKVFLTGGTGFIGGNVARRLRDRGDEVRALVRNPARGKELAGIGCELVNGDLDDGPAIGRGMTGCDAVIHGAAIYKVGIPKRERRAMYDANVLGTERVLRAALQARIPKVVYISTVAAFGQTDGDIVDESYRHSGKYGSYYDETKHKAHEIARRLIDDEGLPCIIVQPGGVYGPGDHSDLGEQIIRYVDGKTPAIMSFPDFGMTMVHVDDVADGVLLCLDEGKTGEQYVLGGQVTTVREIFDTLARITGRKPPRKGPPPAILKAFTPVGPVVGKLMGAPPNLAELIRTSEGAYWAKHDKAMRELDYSPRNLEQGLWDTLKAAGKLPETATA
jgi:nucleoside-diphosphate-sugar epimerase